jgi:signal transduction histidine kinase
VKLPSRLTVLTGTLLVLLPALAVLQYRWVGQLSDAARDRMQRNLHNAAQQFRESFDGEVARAFISLQVDSGIVREQAWSRYAERHAAWASTAPYPGLVANIYLIDALAGDLRLRRWDGHARVFAPAPWEGPLANARTHFRTELSAFASGGRRRFDRTAFHEHEALLVAPLVNLQFGPVPAQPPMHQSIVTVFGYTVIELNLPLIREQLLPMLAQRHFTVTGGDAYRVAVIDTGNSGKVLYSSPQGPVDPARADVSVPIFGAHHDPIMFLARGAPRDAREPRNLVVSVIREKREANVTMHTRAANPEGGRWRLLAQHESGSLEAAVGGVRQRNLLVSFGILMLMAVSIGLLAVSSRRAQRLAQQQMEFVAGVSHELRTPVAVIRSAAENLSHGVVGDPNRVRRYGDAIQVEARRLGEMVERVLEFAGIESGRRLVRAPVAVEPLVQEAIGATVAGDDHRYTVERQIADDLPPVLGDASMLRSALQNLLANAIKYGGSDDWIGVRAQLSPDKREVRVTVEDHGAGIAETDLPHIFDPFYRGADATNRQIQGSGLGLTLVRRIADAHGGRVTIATQAGSGSAFTLHLPAAASTPDAIVLRTANEAAAR